MGKFKNKLNNFKKKHSLVTKTPSSRFKDSQKRFKKVKLKVEVMLNYTDEAEIENLAKFKIEKTGTVILSDIDNTEILLDSLESLTNDSYIIPGNKKYKRIIVVHGEE